MHIFVYGTLMQGECRFSLLPRKPKSIRPAFSCGRLIDIGGEYPGLLMEGEGNSKTKSQNSNPKNDGEEKVHGELMEFEDHDEVVLFDALDDIEGYYGPGQQNYYDRIRIPVSRKDTDEVTEAWAYIYAAGDGPWPEILSGDWRKRGEGSLDLRP